VLRLLTLDGGPAPSFSMQVNFSCLFHPLAHRKTEPLLKREPPRARFSAVYVLPRSILFFPCNGETPHCCALQFDVRFVGLALPALEFRPDYSAGSHLPCRSHA